MGLWLFNNREETGHKNHIEPIRQMLDNTWALSKTFHVPPGSMVADSIGLFNIFFKRLNGIVGSILKSVVSLSSMAPGLSIFSTGFRNTCLEQEKTISGISRAGVSIACSVGEIAENAEHLAVDSKKIYAQVQDSLCLGEKSMEQFNEIKSFVDDLAHTINELDENSISIGSILDMIGTISDESTILSLNARIEASRESGNAKGFKVIAEEMSTLAKQTKGATLKIQEKLDHLRATVAGSVTAMKNVEKNVSTGEKLMDKANIALKSVHQGFDSLAGNIDMIKAKDGVDHKVGHIYNERQ